MRDGCYLVIYHLRIYGQRLLKSRTLMVVGADGLHFLPKYMSAFLGSSCVCLAACVHWNALFMSYMVCLLGHEQDKARRCRNIAEISSMSMG